MRTFRLLCGDARELASTLAAASFDACLCDPPYGLTAGKRGGQGVASVNLETPYGRARIGTGNGAGGFMGMKWDAQVPPAEVWAAILDTLKPGAMLVAFGGSRTFHRLACAIEDAGFEIRDTLCFLYGGGFPKSLDISKAIDKSRRRDYVLAAMELGLEIPGNNLHDWTTAEHSPGDKWWESFRAVLSPEQWGAVERAVVGKGQRKNDRDAVSLQMGRRADEFDLTAPATVDAARWAGMGTALKPAWEPITLAMRPLDGTFAANALAHGVAGLNVDGCRIVGAKPDTTRGAGGQHGSYSPLGAQGRILDDGAGRWPANLVLTHTAECRQIGTREIATSTHYPKQRGIGGLSTDGHGGQSDLEERRPGHETVEAWECSPECPVLMLDEQSGELTSGTAVGGLHRRSDKAANCYGAFAGRRNEGDVCFGDSGGASRFFYCGKADTAERSIGGIRCTHPTLKPIDLCAWLAKLILPPPRADGSPRRLLVPFSGAGSEIIGALRAGWDEVVGIESSEEYVGQARARISGDAPLLNREDPAAWTTTTTGTAAG